MAKVVTARDMLMSIILCTHRSDRYDDFEEALNSLYAQSYNNFEIIVVDDCSTDSTAQKLDDMSYDKLRVIRHSRNRGYGAALKTGFAACIFPLIAITDADGKYTLSVAPGATLVFSYVGYKTYEKNIEVIIKSLKIIKKRRFTTTLLG